MADQEMERKPSETALFATLRRALAYKKYKDTKFGPDRLAEYFLPSHYRFFLKFKSVRVNTTNKLDSFFPGLTEFVIARTRYFDHVFTKALSNKVPQIVLLGAGYDSRAYRFADLNKGIWIYELDAAPTQEMKKKYLRKAKVKVPNLVTFVPIDFNRESLKDVLESAGYDVNQQTLFIWEGVTYYLESASVEATLKFVSDLPHPDTRIVFDYTISTTTENMKEFYGAEAFAQSMNAEHEDEELLFSIEEGGIEPFLNARGLRMIEHLNNHEIEEAFLTREDGELIGRMTGHFRFAAASN